MWHIIPTLFLFLHVNHCLCQLGLNETMEQNLTIQLLTSYNKYMRPKSKVSIALKFSLKQIPSLDEKNQILTTNGYISHQWTDPRLAWNASLFNDIESIMLPAKSIWLPDSSFVNSVDGDGYLKISDFTFVYVDYNGTVYYSVPTLGLKTRCRLQTNDYPFDTQICRIRIQSWAYTVDQLYYSFRSAEIDLSDYKTNGIWDLKDTTMYIGAAVSIRNPLNYKKNTEIYVELLLARKPLYYMINSVFPCIVLNLITLIAFSLPYSNQVSLCMTLFLTFSVYSLRIASDIPVQSDFLPKISIYFIISIIYALISMLWFIFCNHFTTKNKMPFFLYKLASILQSFSFVETVKKVMKIKKSKINGNKVESIAIDVDLAVTLANATGLDTGKEGQNGIDKSYVETVVENLHHSKNKCVNCDRCETCQIDYNKKKDKDELKKDIEAKASLINCLVFSVILVGIFISQVVIWTVKTEFDDNSD